MKKEVKNATMMPWLTKFMFVVGFLLTTIMSYANNLAYAQNQTFTFHLKNVSIKTVLQTIEKQSEFIFMYRSDLLDTSKKVSVDADKKSVSQILDQILEGTAVTYEINDRQIVLKKDVKQIEISEQTVKRKKRKKQNADSTMCLSAFLLLRQAEQLFVRHLLPFQHMAAALVHCMSKQIWMRKTGNS